MFGFGRKKKPRGTASTFVEATGGGWHDAPQVVRVPRSGTEGDYVGEMLRQAHEYAVAYNIPIGEEFEFTITDIPMGIESPHSIIFGLMVRASDYGLSPSVAMNESIRFTRVA